MTTTRISNNIRKLTLRGPGGLTIELDRDRIVEDDPGADTPALVCLPKGGGSSTFWFALDTGTIMGSRVDVDVTPDQMQWLESSQALVEDFLFGGEQ